MLNALQAWCYESDGGGGWQLAGFSSAPQIIIETLLFTQYYPAIWLARELWGAFDAPFAAGSWPLMNEGVPRSDLGGNGIFIASPDQIPPTQQAVGQTVTANVTVRGFYGRTTKPSRPFTSGGNPITCNLQQIVMAEGGTVKATNAVNGRDASNFYRAVILREVDYTQAMQDNNDQIIWGVDILQIVGLWQ